MFGHLSLGLLVWIWRLRASVAEGLPNRIDSKTEDGITLNGAWSNPLSSEDHFISEGSMGQPADLHALSVLTSEMMKVVQQLNRENSLLRDQVVRDMKTMAALSSSVEVLQQQLADLSEQTDVMRTAMNFVPDFEGQLRNVSDRLAALEGAGETPGREPDWVNFVKLSDMCSVSCEEMFSNVTAELQRLSQSVQRLTTADAVTNRPVTTDNVDRLTVSPTSTDLEQTTWEIGEGSGEASGEWSSLPTFIEEFERLLVSPLIWGEAGKHTEGLPEGSWEEHSGNGPTLDFSVPSYAIDKGDSLITSLAVTNDRKVVMVDYAQQEVKVASLDAPSDVGKGLPLSARPWSLALLSDGLVAVSTEDERTLFFVNVSSPEPRLQTTATTERAYRGIAQGLGDTLVASSRRDPGSGLSARIDVVTPGGDVMRTLLDGADHWIVKNPFFLTRYGDEVYVSDWGSHRVYRVNLRTGAVQTTFSTLDLSKLEMFQPRVVAFDPAGNMYVASGGKICNQGRDQEGWCVVLITRNGTWKNLINFNNRYDTMFPYGVAMTPTGIVVSWGRWDRSGGWRTELTAYSLPPFSRVPAGQLPLVT